MANPSPKVMETTIGIRNCACTEVSNNRVSILVDAAERAGDIDVGRAKRAMEKAKERLAADRGSKEIDFNRAEAALKRAVARLKVAEKTS